ncbi:Ocs element-binding factor 1 [Ananas comosus]|uniref:Ocs element-binding factor 1 n=1 Tax=Ananas comosus TaxID=4615 RepID=A0A199V757_ANACO|nr:Ocs element-binding factor 1 [Ananas comosus]
MAMASSSGTTTPTTSATSSEGCQGEEMLEQKKRRRMQSNRESARRSRMRKQQHLEGLAEQAAALQAENARAVAALNLAARSRAAVEAENAVLRTQLLELSSRLGSLNEILLHCVNMARDQQPPLYVNQSYNSSNNNNNNFLMSNNNNNAWNSNYLGCMMNQQHPIMASTDMLDYYY